MDTPTTAVPPTASVGIHYGSMANGNGIDTNHESKSAPSISVISRMPPPINEPYEAADALEDLPGISYALELFVASHMLESEEYCHKSDPEK
jgi:hypothetical protein